MIQIARSLRVFAGGLAAGAIGVTVFAGATAWADPAPSPAPAVPAPAPTEPAANAPALPTRAAAPRAPSPTFTPVGLKTLCPHCHVPLQSTGSGSLVVCPQCGRLSTARDGRAAEPATTTSPEVRT